MSRRFQKLTILLHSAFLVEQTPPLSEELNRKIGSQTNAFRRAAGLGDITLGQVVARVIMGFLAIMGIIFISLIVYGGFTWMTARGNEEKIKRAQDILKHAIWGLIITLAAYSIAYFILGYLITGGAVGVTSF